MAEYGYYKKAKRRRTWRNWAVLCLKVFDLVMLVLSAACIVLLVCAYLSKFVDPGKTAFFAFPGLLFPVVYVVSAFLMLYWVVRWKLYALAIALVMLLGIGNTRLFYGLDVKKRYTENRPAKGEPVIMSYNLMGLNQQYGTEDVGIQTLVGEFVKANHIDILCMQEFPLQTARNRELNTILSDLRYRYVVPYHENGDDIALAIYSRYPIINRGTVGNGAQTRTTYADIRILRDTVRIINNHLQSTTISGDDVDFIKGRLRTDDDSGEERARGIVRKMAENYGKRAPQARLIAEAVRSSPYQVIVCGDFNDTPLSYAYHKVSRGMQDSFVKRGCGLPGTYNGFFNMFRIDYIFMSGGLEVKNYYTFGEVYSDHNAIAAGFEFVKE